MKYRRQKINRNETQPIKNNHKDSMQKLQRNQIKNTCCSMKRGRRKKWIYFAANVLIAWYKHGAIKLMMMIAHNEDYHELNPMWMEVNLRWWPIMLAIEIKKEMTAHPNLALFEFIYNHSLSIKINDYIDYQSQFFRVNFVSTFRHVCMNAYFAM